MIRECRGMIVAAALLAGCGTRVDYMQLNPPPHPVSAHPGDSVEVFMSKAPERPYVEVGMIEAQQESGLSTDQQGDILAKMRQEAGRQGCDGLIFMGPNDQTVVSGTSSRSGGNVSSTTLRGYRGSCIVYR